ncbi:hypothetical protein V5799_012337 [Amblyomma americanum]|uniref:Cytochrome n=1 Tax=Amblyomma americanum TaxID=6943 RepID=A0AAQ4EEK3_AMBAM
MRSNSENWSHRCLSAVAVTGLATTAARHPVGNLLSFFIAAFNTVANTLQWQVLNFADKPDTVQARIRQEIDDVVGRERQPAWQDWNKMPYLMACIWEMYRWKTISPLGVPRRYAAGDFGGVRDRLKPLTAE